GVGEGDAGEQLAMAAGWGNQKEGSGCAAESDRFESGRSPRATTQGGPAARGRRPHSDLRYHGAYCVLAEWPPAGGPFWLWRSHGQSSPCAREDAGGNAAERL